MKPHFVCASLIMLPVLVAGCAFGYVATATLDGVPGELRGKAFPGNTQGGGRFVVADRSGFLQCEGEMAPPDHADRPGECLGESGQGIVRCSDGRTLAARWTALSCRSFEGTAEDTRGRRLDFRVERRR